MFMRLFNGFYLSFRARSIEIEEIGSSGSIFVQSNGELLGFLPRKSFVLHGVIELLC